ncbi:unnamed protein product [Microthlaspi erraticum]|uniref:C2 domain-containing protein n=1 Tax=Microthlaspi erraticum TaxID=1685480 RepID=A0A6D2L7D3_9BRAS|nr:unnamed protein product [Microthlaspi erraticum]
MIREGKRTMNHNIETKLIVKIFRAAIIDDTTLLKPYNGSSYYRVVAYTDTEDQYATGKVEVLKRNYWEFNQELVISLDFPAEYLYIELLRSGSSFKDPGTWRDPGTSSGMVVMGQGKVRLSGPTKHGKFSGAVGLFGLNSDRCVLEKGTLELSLELRKIVVS